MSIAHRPSHTSAFSAHAGSPEVFPTAAARAADAPGRTGPTGVTMSSRTGYSPLLSMIRAREPPVNSLDGRTAYPCPGAAYPAPTSSIVVAKTSPDAMRVTSV